MRPVRTIRERKVSLRPTSAVPARIGTLTCALQPETVGVEALYAFADGDGARALIKIGEVMGAANYHRYSPECDWSGSRRAASHGSVVFRNRTLLHCERKDLELPELQRLALPDGDTVAESLESHLVSKEDTPQDSFVGGTIVGL